MHAQQEPPKYDHIKIAFVSYRTGSADVYLMNTDGSNIEQITNTAEDNRFPTQIDQKTIGFTRFYGDRTTKKFQIDVVTKEEKAQEIDPIVESAEWEVSDPSGRYVAYVKNTDRVNDLFLYDKNSKEEVQVTSNVEDSLFAHSINHRWSYNGEKIAFMSGPDWYDQFVRVYDLKTGKTEILTTRGYMNSGLLWLKDNKTLIVNIKIRNKTIYELWSLNTDTKELKQLTEGANLHPALSPDGEWVLFESQRHGDDGELYIMRPDGSRQIRLTDSPEYEGRAMWFETQ